MWLLGCLACTMCGRKKGQVSKGKPRVWVFVRGRGNERSGQEWRQSRGDEVYAERTELIEREAQGRSGKSMCVCFVWMCERAY